MHGGGGEGGVSRVNVGPPNAAGVLAVNAEVVGLTRLIAKPDHVAGSLRGEKPLLEQSFDVDGRQLAAPVEIGDQLLDHFHKPTLREEELRSSSGRLHVEHRAVRW